MEVSSGDFVDTLLTELGACSTRSAAERLRLKLQQVWLLDFPQLMSLTDLRGCLVCTFERGDGHDYRKDQTIWRATQLPVPAPTKSVPKCHRTENGTAESTPRSAFITAAIVQLNRSGCLGLRLPDCCGTRCCRQTGWLVA